MQSPAAVHAELISDRQLHCFHVPSLLTTVSFHCRLVNVFSLGVVKATLVVSCCDQHAIVTDAAVRQPGLQLPCCTLSLIIHLQTDQWSMSLASLHRCGLFTQLSVNAVNSRQ